MSYFMTLASGKAITCLFSDFYRIPGGGSGVLFMECLSDFLFVNNITGKLPV